jgi:hypothetical protein
MVVISVSKHFRRPKGECVPLLAVEMEGLEGRVHEGGGGEVSQA